MAVNHKLRHVFSSDIFAAIVVGLATFTDTFMYCVIVPIFPHILLAQVHVPAERIQFWTSVSLGVFGGGHLVAIVAATYITKWMGSSSRLPFLSGLIFINAATVLLFFGTEITGIIVARVLQGASAAFVWVSGFTLVTHHVDASFVPTVMGFATAGAAFGDLVGPVAGGSLYQYGGRLAVFVLAQSVLVIDFISRALLRDKTSSDDDERVQERQRLLAAAMDRPEVAAVAEGEEASDSLDSKRSGRQVNYRALYVSWAAILVTGTFRCALEAALPLFVSQQYHWSTSASGAVMFAFICPNLLAPAVSTFAAKHDSRWLQTIFMVLNGCAFLVLLTVRHNETAAKVGLIVAIVAIGSAWTVVTNGSVTIFGMEAKHSQSSSKGDESGQLFGAMTFAWAISQFAGPLLADVLLEHTGWNGFVIFFAGLSALMALILAVL